MSNLVRAKSWLPNIQLAYPDTNTSPEIVWKLIEAATSDVAQGAPVIATAAARTVTLATAASAAIYGIAMAAGVAGDTIPVLAANQDSLFMCKANAALNTITVLPLACDLAVAAGVWSVNPGAVLVKAVYIIDVMPGDDETDTVTFGRVLFHINKSSYSNLTTP